MILTQCNIIVTRAHKNGRQEYECVTPIEAHSPVKIIELLLKIEHPVHMCLVTTAYVLLFLVTVQ